MGFVCNVCTKSFSQKHSLLRHQRNACKGTPAPATPPANHTCAECGKMFGLKHNLLRHERTHHAPPAFHCDSCDASFTQRTSMITHMKTCSGPSFPCVRCLRCVWIDVCFRKKMMREKKCMERYLWQKNMIILIKELDKVTNWYFILNCVYDKMFWFMIILW